MNCRILPVKSLFQKADKSIKWNDHTAFEAMKRSDSNAPEKYYLLNNGSQ